MGFEGITAIVVPIVVALAWLFRLEGKVNGHTEQFDDLRDDVRYIRDRVDRALSNGHGRDK